MKKIETPHAPKALGPYSQAVAAGQFVFISGQIGIDPKTNTLVDSTIQGQTRQVLNNIEAILHAANLSWENLVKTEIYLTSMEDFQEVNKLYGEKFPHAIKPARQTLEVSKLPLNALIEISCIALLKN